MFFLRLFFEKIRRRISGEQSVRIFDVVILVDMQADYLKRINKCKQARMIRGQIKVLRYCASHDIPVVILEVVNKGKTINKLRKEVGKIPRYKTLIKKHNDGFSEKDLLLILKGWQALTLLFMGINATACVLDTAIRGKRYGFNILTTSCLMADPDSWKENFWWFEKNGTHLDSVDRLLTQT